MKKFEDQNRIKELYILEHWHDNMPNNLIPYDYSNNLLKRNISGVLLRNKNMENFLSKLNDLIVYNLDQISYLRNVKNPIVDKYFNGYIN